jgi:hypothetical protein
MTDCISSLYKPYPVLRIRDVYPESLIPDPVFYPSRIPDLGSKTATKERGEKICWLYQYLFCSYKFQKIVNYFIFKMLKKKFAPIFKEL